MYVYVYMQRIDGQCDEFVMLSLLGVSEDWWFIVLWFQGKIYYLQFFFLKLYNKFLLLFKRKCFSLVSMDVFFFSLKVFRVFFLRVYVKVFYNGIYNRGKLLNKEKESCLNILNVEE